MSMLSVNPLEDELPVFVIPEPAVFNDDEQIYLQPETAVGGGDYEIPPLLEITTYTAFPAIQESVGTGAVCHLDPVRFDLPPVRPNGFLGLVLAL